MNSFISWVGGKKLLRKQIVELFPTNFDRYIEVFGGAAWVMLANDNGHAKLEVYNDIDSNLVNLFRCVKYHPEELQKCILPINSYEHFACLKEDLSRKGLTDIQRAAIFFMLIRTSYGSNRKQFGCNKKGILSGIEGISEIHSRLEKVVIENRSFADLIRIYDREQALFYCDPPYYKTEKMYDNIFTESDHILLRDSLAKIKGKFILSYNDSTFIRDLYKDFEIISVERQNNLAARNGGAPYKELIIKNY